MRVQGAIGDRKIVGIASAPRQEGGVFLTNERFTQTCHMSFRDGASAGQCNGGRAMVPNEKRRDVYKTVIRRLSVPPGQSVFSKRPSSSNVIHAMSANCWRFPPPRSSLSTFRCDCVVRFTLRRHARACRRHAVSLTEL